jgi:hypothetical protein
MLASNVVFKVFRSGEFFLKQTLFRVKDFSCNSFSGGWAAAAAVASAELAVSNGVTTAEKRPFFASRISNDQETCGGHLIACQSNLYHAQMQVPFVSHNLVTMLREPVARLISNLEMRGVSNASSVVEVVDATAKNKKPFINIQAAFISGRSVNISGWVSFWFWFWRTDGSDRCIFCRLSAIESLKNNFVFYGLTDYWGLSVCVFHCELGGEFSSVECQNVRPRLNSALVIDDASTMLHRYVAEDRVLYEFAKAQFFERVKRCNCVDLCASQQG